MLFLHIHPFVSGCYLLTAIFFAPSIDILADLTRGFIVVLKSIFCARVHGCAHFAGIGFSVDDDGICFQGVGDRSCQCQACRC